MPDVRGGAFGRILVGAATITIPVLVSCLNEAV
jgi:hypothetical protein